MAPGFLMERFPSKAGFTLVEVILALVMLSAVVLSMASGASKYLSTMTRNRLRIQAGAVADAQIAAVLVSPAYDSLTIRFDSTTAGVPFPGYTRTTRVVRTGTGTTADRTAVMVTVTGPGLTPAVTRYATVAAP
jgi:prepilin-type N-terminal cleavage/methylation domain-containing protein